MGLSKDMRYDSAGNEDEFPTIHCESQNGPSTGASLIACVQSTQKQKFKPKLNTMPIKTPNNITPSGWWYFLRKLYHSQK